MTDEKKIFLDNCWYAAAWDYEVAEADNKLGRTICEKSIVFFKAESGVYAALDDRCCHRAAPLSVGRIEGNNIRCMYHGLVYNPDGKCIEVPGQETQIESLGVRSYPVVERGHMLWIWMGDPALANPDDIHDYPPLSDPENWCGFPRQSYLHYKANWLLVVDNLSDFSHIAFVHTNTVGGSEEYAYVSVPEELERLDDGFRLERWHYNSNVPPYHAKVIPENERTGKVDRRNLVEIRVPGLFFMETLFAPAGVDIKTQDIGQYRQYRNCQFMTPETRNTTHFFWNYLRNYDMDKPEITESLQASLLEAFGEDKAIIEEQQKLLVKDTSFDPRFIKADKALAHFRRIWKKKLEEEEQKYPTKPTEESRHRIL